MPAEDTISRRFPPPLRAASLVIIGAAALWLANASPALAGLALIEVLAACLLAAAPTIRLATYGGFALGALIGITQLFFFWNIFTGGALILWVITGAWMALFCILAWLARRRFGCRIGTLLLPILWTGVEYFRSELNPLRFAWLTPGMAFGGAHTGLLNRLGDYGIGFVMAALAALALLAGLDQCWTFTRLTQPIAPPPRAALKIAAVIAAALLLGSILASYPLAPRSTDLPFAACQLELPDTSDVLAHLTKLHATYRNAQLLVLSEDTFVHHPPAAIADWCRRAHVYLMLGAWDDKIPGRMNTIYVYDPAGRIIFIQGKAQPIQFMRDGIPAPTQRVWHSPWGAIGVCICYDLSFTRVTDRLIEQEARLLIVPTMDAQQWGRAEHVLHAHIAPMRAEEYGVPVLRVASSGISQWVDPTGGVEKSLPFPGQGDTFAGTIELSSRGHLPPDRWLAPMCVGITALLVLLMLIPRKKTSLLPSSSPGNPPQVAGAPSGG